MIKTIITHDGQAHADEALAIAIYKRYVNEDITVIRTRKKETIEQGQHDAYTLVLDVGRKYEQFAGNLDHHHDSDLEASCILMMEWIVANYPVNFPSMLWVFALQVSHIDTGKIDKGGPKTFFNFKVRMLNESAESWDDIMDLCDEVVDNLSSRRSWHESVKVQEYNTLAGSIYNRMLDESRELWEDKEVFAKESHIAINLHPTHPSPKVLWQDLESGKEDPILWTLVGYNPSQNCYVVLAYDCINHPIPASDKQVFRHASGFMASYSNYQDAIYHMRELQLDLKRIK